MCIDAFVLITFFFLGPSSSLLLRLAVAAVVLLFALLRAAVAAVPPGESAVEGDDKDAFGGIVNGVGNGERETGRNSFLPWVNRDGDSDVPRELHSSGLSFRRCPHLIARRVDGWIQTD